MKALIVGAIFCALLISLGAQGTSKELSELSKLKVENLKLTAQLTQCQVKTTQQDLITRQTELELQFKTELGCTGKFDWQSLGCENEKKNPPIK